MLDVLECQIKFYEHKQSFVMGNIQNRAKKNKRNARNWRNIIQMRLVRAGFRYQLDSIFFSRDQIFRKKKPKKSVGTPVRVEKKQNQISEEDILNSNFKNNDITDSRDEVVRIVVYITCNQA